MTNLLRKYLHLVFNEKFQEVMLNQNKFPKSVVKALFSYINLIPETYWRKKFLKKEAVHSDISQYMKSVLLTYPFCTILTPSYYL
jgi:hypothetical protein